MNCWETKSFLFQMTDFKWIDDSKCSAGTYKQMDLVCLDLKTILLHLFRLSILQHIVFICHSIISITYQKFKLRFVKYWNFRFGMHPKICTAVFKNFRPRMQIFINVQIVFSSLDLWVQIHNMIFSKKPWVQRKCTHCTHANNDPDMIYGHNAPGF